MNKGHIIFKLMCLKKILLSIIVSALALCLYGQILSIESGTMFIGEQTVLALHETSLINNSELLTSPNSLIKVSGRKLINIDGISALNIHHLLINSECVLNTNLFIIDSIGLESGNLDMSDFSINLTGNIYGESNLHRIYSTGSGEIIKNIDLFANSEVNPGNMGLNLEVNKDIPNFELRRGHENIEHNLSTSIGRYFSFSSALKNFTFSFSYLNPEVKVDMQNSLAPWGELNMEWIPIYPFELDTANNKIVASALEEYSILSLFPKEPDNILMPKGFSPNNDGINDMFYIEGIEQFPENKLVIFNQWGEVLFEAAPYLNNWEGISSARSGSNQNNKLFDGTYFYLFYRNTNIKNDILKGSFEIKGDLN